MKTPHFEPPILVLEDDGGVALFESFDVSLGHYEWPEMLSFEFHDGAGRPIRVAERPGKRRWFWRSEPEPIIELAPHEPRNLLLLRLEIVRFFLTRPEHGWAREELFALWFEELKQQLVLLVGFTRR